MTGVNLRPEQTCGPEAAEPEESKMRKKTQSKTFRRSLGKHFLQCVNWPSAVASLSEVLLEAHGPSSFPAGSIQHPRNVQKQWPCLTGAGGGFIFMNGLHPSQNKPVGPGKDWRCSLRELIELHDPAPRRRGGRCHQPEKRKNQNSRKSELSFIKSLRLVESEGS